MPDAADPALDAAATAGTDAQWFVAGHAHKLEVRASERRAIMAEALRLALPHLAPQRAESPTPAPEGASPVSQDPESGSEAQGAEDRARVRQLESALYDVLGHITEKGHPGYEALRTPWMPVQRVERWRLILHQPHLLEEAPDAP